MTETLASLLLALLTIVNGWLVFVLRSLKEDLKELRTDHTNLVAKQQAHELLMARSMITREEFRTEMTTQTGTLKDFMTHLVRNGK